MKIKYPIKKKNRISYLKIIYKFFPLLGLEMEEFWSILIIKQYFAECVFVLAPWLF